MSGETPTQKQIESHARQMYKTAAKRVFSNPENLVFGSRSEKEKAIWRERARHDLIRAHHPIHNSTEK